MACFTILNYNNYKYNNKNTKYIVHTNIVLGFFFLILEMFIVKIKNYIFEIDNSKDKKL